MNISIYNIYIKLCAIYYNNFYYYFNKSIEKKLLFVIEINFI